MIWGSNKADETSRLWTCDVSQGGAVLACCLFCTCCQLTTAHGQGKHDDELRRACSKYRGLTITQSNSMRMVSVLQAEERADVIIESRGGAVLGALTILKEDYFPGMKSSRLPQLLPGQQETLKPELTCLHSTALLASVVPEELAVLACAALNAGTCLPFSTNLTSMHLT